MEPAFNNSRSLRTELSYRAVILAHLDVIKGNESLITALVHGMSLPGMFIRGQIRVINLQPRLELDT